MPRGVLRRRVLLALAVLVVGVAGGTAAVAGGNPPSQPPPAPPSLTYSPADGTDEVSPTVPVTVSVTGGVLTEVTLRDPQGRLVAGDYSADRRTWTTREQLAYATTYTWSGAARGPQGTVTPLAGSFTTVRPAKLVRGVLNIGDGRVVGIAAPIEIQFDAHVSDRAAVERALSVRTSVPVEGAWGWLPDENGGSRVHWRPREYWPPGTEVTVTADLYGVHFGDGAYGRANLSSTFRIGRAQIVKADVRSHRMIVVRDGVVVANYPASYGLSSDPDRTTRSGIHVVTEKHAVKRMVSRQFGYDVLSQWAVRISNNGEFIHANPATTAQQGSANVTHGCINLSPQNAREYYQTALYGDPVEVTGSGVPLSARDGDIWDWTLSWEAWRKLSALDDEAPGG